MTDYRSVVSAALEELFLLIILSITSEEGCIDHDQSWFHAGKLSMVMSIFRVMHPEIGEVQVFYTTP